MKPDERILNILREHEVLDVMRYDILGSSVVCRTCGDKSFVAAEPIDAIRKHDLAILIAAGIVIAPTEYAVGDTVKAADLRHLPAGAVVDVEKDGTMHKVYCDRVPHWVISETGRMIPQDEIGDNGRDEDKSRIAYLPPVKR